MFKLVFFSIEFNKLISVWVNYEYVLQINILIANNL